LKDCYSTVRSKLIECVHIRTADNNKLDKSPDACYLCNMIQSILIGLVFLGAAFYLGRMAYRSFQAKEGCATGCAKCGVAEATKKLQQN